MTPARREYLYQTARAVGYRIRRTYARELRKHPTPAESFLWEALRPYGTGGNGWRRQHIVDRFIVDLVHVGARLAVEVDGGYHAERRQRLIDADRDECLRHIGWRVVRITDEEVLADAGAVGEFLAALASGRLPAA